MTEVNTEFEAVIGLEMHCQLATNSKIFCGCRARLPGGKSVADVEVNSNTCAICAGHPGTLPVLNKKVVEYGIRAGLATHCKINHHTVLSRKNYFYPDLPKGYQLSQYADPLCEHGWIDIETSEGKKRVNIQRIHMEEDAGKNIHTSDYSLVNLNRAGVPLIEIVTFPDMKTPEEAGLYLRSLYSIVTFLEITDGNMQEGNFRCDANVSIKPKGAKELGTRTEIKNVNSFRFVEKAIEYEIARQIQLVQSGGKVVQETRTYDSDKNIALTMRSKEEAHDYRYFPDPDLVPVNIDPSWVEKIRSELPELPEQKRNRLVTEFGLSEYDAATLTGSKVLIRFFDQVMEVTGISQKGSAKLVANWVTGEVARLMNETGIGIDQSKLRPAHLVELIHLLQSQAISTPAAKQVLPLVWESGDSVESLIERQGLKQVSDVGALEAAIDKVIAKSSSQVAEYRSGKEKVLGYFVGQVMKESGGKANPGLVGELLKKKLSEK